MFSCANFAKKQVDRTCCFCHISVNISQYVLAVYKQLEWSRLVKIMTNSNYTFCKTTDNTNVDIVNVHVFIVWLIDVHK